MPTTWRPAADAWETTRVGRFGTEHGAADLGALLARSVDDPEWFWDAVVRHLGIPFTAPYERVRDDSAGIPWTTWFTGGRTNLADACCDRWADETPDAEAIAWEGEEGTRRSWTYAELRAEADGLAHLLQAEGVGPGDAVGIFLPMLPETIAAVLAVATGDPLSLGSGIALAVIVAGVVVAAGGEPAEEGAPPRRRQRASYVAPLVATAGAVSFGFGLFSASQVGDDLNPLWVAFLPRVLGLAVVVVPVALRSGGLRLPRPVWPLAAVGGALEVSGLVAFVIAARDDAAIAAVMSSQFAIVTAIGGYLLWDERIGRIQVAGVALVLAGVAGLTLLQA